MNNTANKKMAGITNPDRNGNSSAEMGRDTPSLHQDFNTPVDALDRAGCIAEWRRLIGGRVPKHTSVAFMRKALAYERQCKLFGGLPSSATRVLAAVTKGKRIIVAARPTIQPGTHLMREWNGRTYQVEVTDDGFVLDGRKYRSLSAIAKKITGAHWSGPRFFGITK